jgi:hypothetical protein
MGRPDIGQRRGPDGRGANVTDGWWVFDRPLHRDPLFVVALLCGVAAAVVAVVTRGDVSTFVHVYEIVGGALAGSSLVGIVGGSVRNFVRGYREGRPS